MIRTAGLAGLVVLAGLSGGCVAPRALPSGAEPVDARYAVSGGSYSTGGELIVMLRAHERDGRVVVCGARTRTRESAMSLPYNHFVEGTGVIQLAGANIMQGVRRFPDYPLARDMTGVSAACFLTERPWEPRFEGAAAIARFGRMPLGGDDFGRPDTVFRGGPVPDVIDRP
ncbi:hypothetical protein M1105_01885 [Limibaculum sp. FT325]|uniref:hypothetical protein n=1 Tax=Thermohalobaculum sediminis TaxID=2939436 RepID=UPI0020C085C1|nr:hypothetical protein [Limibaculum sediminis]MCL5775748.1 hypothetical protein [Limibaculum sediminis]